MSAPQIETGIGAGQSLPIRRTLPRVARAAGARVWWSHLVWVAVAGLLGLASSGLLANLVELPRPVFVLVHLLLAGSFLAAYVMWSGADIAGALERKWIWGLVGAVLISAFVISSVLAQDASPRPQGLALVGNLLWLGLVYGSLDALFLSVFPLAAVWAAAKKRGWVESWAGRLLSGALGFAASLYVAVLYHAGFAEYQGSEMLNPIIGNGVFSLGYLLTGNPLTSIFAHVAMHVAAVLHGIETVTQLPPHF